MRVLRLRLLSPEEDRELGLWKRSTDRATWQRARIIELAQQGQTPAQIAVAVDLSPGSVRRWIRQFNRLGFKGLASSMAAGRRPRITPATRRGIVGLLAGSPRAYGYDQDQWSLRMLADVTSRLGLVDSISHEEIRRTLLRTGVRLG